MPIYANMSKYMQIYANICKYMQIYANVCKYIQIYANVYKYIQTSANICKYILIYANICKYKQIYANIVTNIWVTSIVNPLCAICDFHRHFQKSWMQISHRVTWRLICNQDFDRFCLFVELWLLIITKTRLFVIENEESSRNLISGPVKFWNFKITNNVSWLHFFI